ncbi:secreted arabinase, partial [Coprinopsis sp. MPI-PUGE-AT-0042]
ALTFSLLALASSLLTTVLAQAGPGLVTGDIAVHDPTMCKDKNGKWYLFSTAPGIDIRTSTDRTNWVYAGQVFPNGQATWTDAYTGKEQKHLGSRLLLQRQRVHLLQLYYSASSFGSQKSAIFLAKSTSGNSGTWSNLGLVTSTTSANNYNVRSSIDPNLVIDNGRWYLTIGSFWTGIKMFTVDPGTGKPNSSTMLSIASRPANGGALEASSIYKNGNYWYLFVSWDKCCSGTSSTYNIRVGRSSSVTGPFVDQNNVAMTNGGGTLVLATRGSVVGPGGQDVYTDSDGPSILHFLRAEVGHQQAFLRQWLAGEYCL